MNKVALIGYGKMGQKIAELAPHEGVEIAAIIDSKTKITKESLKDATLCIDFSRPEALLPNLKQIASLKKSIVIGTTGWYENLAEVKELVQKHQIGALYAENFTIGMQMFDKILAEAAKLINQQLDYDVQIQETHHSSKLDTPSGTALLLTNTLLQHITRKKQIKLLSERQGEITGLHSVQIDSLFDTITLTHKAHCRDGFALGALKAAHWLSNKKGFYHLKDMLC